jgi:L-2-hydroxyglutarate oxidase
MQYDIVIIGGGIVGLATLYQLKMQQPALKIALLEKETALSKHQSGNNSGVIHSGVYYKPGSLKAKNCRRGYDLLLNFVRQHGINHDVCGKVIVATNKGEIPALETIYQRGLENGLSDISKVDQNELKEIEPHVAGIQGIKVPYAGIVDYPAMALKMAELAKEKGAEVLTGAKVTGFRNNLNTVEVLIEGRTSLITKLVVNCGGLYCDKLVQMSGIKPDFRIIPFRGEYYNLKPEAQYLVNNLIYPVPDPAFPFLGVHFTRMIKGGIEAGPNAVFAFKREGYNRTDVSLKELAESLAWPGFRKVATKYWKTGLGEIYRSFSKSAFTKSLQKLIPEIKESDLEPGGAGVRAQAADRHGGLIDDFMIQETDHFIHVGNAPSPAATSSLSIGLTLSQKAMAHF